MARFLLWVFMQIRYSRSEHSAYAKCPRSWYYSYGMDNATAVPGYEPKEPYLPTTLGLSIHRGMEALFKSGSNVDNAVSCAHSEWDKLTQIVPREGSGNPIYFNAEQKALIEAFIRAFRVSFWDEFNNQFEILQIENELGTQITDNILFQARCDLVVRERSSGLIFIPDWKVVKDARNWDSKFFYEPQTWSQTFAVESALKEEIGGCIYWAFIKGDRRNDQQCSKLIYGYRQEIRPNIFLYETERTKGYTKFPVWEAEDLGPSPSDRIKYWINWLPEEVRSAAFMQSPPITRDAERIKEWALFSSSEMESARDMLKGVPAEMSYPARRSDWNCRGCFAKDLCYGTKELADMNWNPRHDHHAIEGEIE